MKPAYATRCAVMCSDQKGYPRKGDQWVHIWGITQWVCSSCAERMARQAGIPSAHMLRRQTRLREQRMQLGLDLAPETHSGHQAEA